MVANEVIRLDRASARFCSRLKTMVETILNAWGSVDYQVSRDSILTSLIICAVNLSE